MELDRNKSYLIYTPSKSASHGHSIRDKNFERALTKVIQTVTKHFSASPKDKTSITLSYDRQDSTELAIAQNTIDTINDYVGPATRQWDNPGLEHFKHTITWEKISFGIVDLVKYIENCRKRTLLLQWQNIDIIQFYDYTNTDNNGGYFMLSIEQNKVFVRMHLIFPYTLDNPKALEMLSGFSSELPFKLSIKNFRVLCLKNNKFTQWKLDEAWQQKIESALNMKL